MWLNPVGKGLSSPDLMVNTIISLLPLFFCLSQIFLKIWRKKIFNSYSPLSPSLLAAADLRACLELGLIAMSQSSMSGAGELGVRMVV
jgi:hypothetical protein